MLQAEKQPIGSKFQQGREVLLSYFLRRSRITGTGPLACGKCLVDGIVWLFHFVMADRVKAVAQIAEAKNRLPAINGLEITPILPVGIT